MINSQIHEYLRKKRLLKKFAQFLGITEQGLLYRLTKGKKSVYEDVNSFFKSSTEYAEERKYIDSLKSDIELITERTKDLINDKFYCPFFLRLDEYYKNNLDRLLGKDDMNSITKYAKKLQGEAINILNSEVKNDN